MLEKPENALLLRQFMIDVRTDQKLDTGKRRENKILTF